MISFASRLYTRYEERYPRMMKWARFFISGGTGAAINIGILFLLTHVAHLWYLFSSIVAFILSVCASFIFQKFWTFQDKQTDGMHVQAGWYVIVALVNLGINTLIMYACVDGLGWHYVASQIVASLLIAIESYFVYRKLFTRAILLP